MMAWYKQHQINRYEAGQRFSTSIANQLSTTQIKGYEAGWRRQGNSANPTRATVAHTQPMNNTTQRRGCDAKPHGKHRRANNATARPRCKPAWQTPAREQPQRGSLPKPPFEGGLGGRNPLTLKLLHRVDGVGTHAMRSAPPGPFRTRRAFLLKP